MMKVTSRSISCKKTLHGVGTAPQRGPSLPFVLQKFAKPGGIDVRAKARQALLEATDSAANHDVAYFNEDAALSGALQTVVSAKMGMAWPKGLERVLSISGDASWSELMEKQTIMLQNHELGPAEAGALALVTHCSERLKEIDVFGNPIGAIGVTLIADAIRDHPDKCTRLNVRCTGAGPQGGKALAAALRTPGCALTYLNVEYNQLDEPGLTDLFSALPLCGLTELDAKWNSAGNQGARACADALAAPNGTLQRLNLLQCSLTDDQAENIAAGLAASRSIEVLDLSENRYGRKGHEAICKAAMACMTLKSIKIDLPDGVDGGDVVRAAAAREPPLQVQLVEKKSASTGSS